MVLFRAFNMFCLIIVYIEISSYFNSALFSSTPLAC